MYPTAGKTKNLAEKTERIEGDKSVTDGMPVQQECRCKRLREVSLTSGALQVTHRSPTALVHHGLSKSNNETLLLSSEMNGRVFEGICFRKR